MSLFSIFILAIGLAVDSFAVSVARSKSYSGPRLRYILLVASAFAVVQVIMPLVGWQVGVEFQSMVMKSDHWIALAILSCLGGKMVYDGTRGSDQYRPPVFTLSALLLSAVATSIDALVVGFGFGVLNLSVLLALIVIGGVTFTLSFAGLLLGHRMSKRTGQYAEILGGLALIAIGLKIFVDHTI